MKLPLAAALLSCAAAPLAAQTVTVYEFYNGNLSHFFRTANPAEANAINAGAAGPGWEYLLNGDFKAWLSASAPAPAKPVCRFYAAGPNSHFYTADAAECLSLRDLEKTQRAQYASLGQPYPNWAFEEIAFYINVPNSAGQCNAPDQPVYRLYNHRAKQNDSNHRFTTSYGIYSTMLAAGWIPEGIVMCAPT